jgi:hypothetical protein
MKYCDYCDCEDCIKGKIGLSRAQTIDGKWICDLCYYYGVCVRGENSPPAPCAGLCDHRPKIITKWMARRA